MIRTLFVLLAFLIPLAHAEEFLDPAVAFKPRARALDAQTIEVAFEIAKGYYLYRDKFRLAVDGDSVTLGTPVFPKGKEKNDENFGKVEVFYKNVAIRLPVERNASGVLPLKLNVTSQGCADAGVCYPPQMQTISVELPAAGSPAAAPAAVDADESGKIAGILRNAGFWANLAFFFIAGLGLALTPCVLPMIPILSGIIAGQGHKNSHARGFALSLAYVLGMAVTYAAAGIAAGLTGTLLSAALQNAWVLGAFALVFVVLALSMFGFYELQLPAALQSRISNVANAQGGSLPAIALMGALSALIVGPCVAAPLAGALLYIAKTGDALLGGTALFVLALGMGAPLLLVGAFSRTLLPKSGPWMTGVNRFFGVLMLATALWLVSPVLPAWLVMFGWAALLVIPAIYLHALDPLPDHAHGWQRLGKGLGVLLLLGGAAMLAGLLGGARDPLQPLTFLRGAQASAVSPSLYFDKVDDSAALDARLASAGKPVMLDFYADWCVSCKEMERFTFADPAVAQAMGRFVLLKADVTANTDAHKALLARFGLFGPPGIIFFDAAGREIAGTRVVGFQPAEKFLAHLQGIEKGR